MSIYTRWGFGPLYGDIFISLLTLSVKERVIISKLEAIMCVWGGGSFIIANLILFPVKCIRRIEPGACWPVRFVKKYLFKSVYNNLSSDRQAGLEHLPSTDSRGGSAAAHPGSKWQLKKKTQEKFRFHSHPCKSGEILPKSVEIFSIYISVPKRKFWQRFQVSIYKLFLAANKNGGGEDYSLQMLCEINRGFLVTIMPTKIVTLRECF